MTSTALLIQSLTPPQILEIQELYDRGLAVQAYELGIAHAPLHLWQPSEAQVLAGRIAGQIGAPRLGHWLHRQAYRAAPHQPESQYYFALCLAHFRGSYAAWRWLSRRPEPPVGASADLRSSWYALIGNIAATFRDFAAADEWMAKANAAAPDSAWVRVCEASVREAEDRYEEALRLSQEALSLRPSYRPAVQSAAHLLTLLGRDTEALALLRDANQRIESAANVAQQFLIELEHRDYAAANQSLDRYAALSPLLEKHGREWLAAQRADVAYHLGDIEAAIRHARESNNDYGKIIAQRLADSNGEAHKSVLLPVGFVRQHHVTCGPATLTAISRFWSMPADHLQVAEEICYSGTTHYHERKWAADNGWVAREFSVTEECAVALLDRGIPFTFTTIEPANAHLQAIIGYDRRRGTLSLRDPYFRNSGEALADKLLERYRAYGPRGMLLVPKPQASLLDDVHLPDVELWDQLHALDRALHAHHRDAAGPIVKQLETAAPAHRLTWEARRRLAIYDANATDQLAAVEALLAQFPDNQSLQLQRLSLLCDHSRREDRLADFERLLAKRDTHPIFWQQYAQELRPDARRHDDAVWRLRRAIRRWPTEAANYHTLASIYWDQRRLDEALELYRFAACLGDKDEQFIQSYFRAGVWFKDTERVLALLRDRFQRFGKQSYLPAASLAAAYLELERVPEALAVLDAAISLRPDDGELLLYAADMLAISTTQHLPRTRALLEQAKEKSPPAQWLRTAAKLQRIDGDLPGALILWQEVLELQPLALDAHRAAARLLAETASTAAALQHLSAAAERFPHYYPLHQLWAEWLRGEPIDQREPVLRRLVAAFPHDAWAHRELGFLLAEARRLDEAWQASAIAERLEPTNPSTFHLTAALHKQANQLAEARQALRTAIELGVDNDLAIRELIDLSPTPAERRSALTFVKNELVKQVTFGDGLLSYREQARGTLDPQELLALLQQALASRPDLWHAWSAVAQQLLGMNERDEAWSVIQQATDHFPLLPRLWLDRAEICRARQDALGELESLRTAYRISPRWNTAVYSLAAAEERRGDYAAARDLLERAVAREPLDALLRGLWAESLWRAGHREAALAQVQRVIQFDPSYDRAWDLLHAWSKELQGAEQALESVRELTRTRGGEAAPWLFLARLLDAPDKLDERLAALDKASELSPRDVDAHDQRALALAAARRFDEALAACCPPVFGNHPPPELRCRAAWIEAQRGDLPLAIARLREVVADSPGYFGAWSLLADWHSQLQDHEHYLEAAQALVRISPQYEVGHGYLGEALLRTGDRPAAIEAFRRAIALNPQYEFAGMSLFDLQLEDNDVGAAAETMKVLRAHSEGDFVLAREAKLAALQQHTGRAAEILERFAANPSTSPDLLDFTVASLAQASAARTAEDVLEKLFSSPTANPHIGRLWVRLQIDRSIWCGAYPLQQLLEKSPPVGEQAVYAYLDALARQSGPDHLTSFIYANSSWLRNSTPCWGAVGYSLTLLRNYASTAKWMSDWRERSDAQSWMLVNTVEGLRGIGGLDEAREVSFAALEKPSDNGTPLHNLWLASDAAAAGDAASAAAFFQSIDRSALDADYQFLATCVASVLNVAAAPPDQASQTFRQAYRSLMAARRQYAAFPHEPARKRLFRRCLMQIARLRGTLLARIFCSVEWIFSH